jgi:hypothetical protein
MVLASGCYTVLRHPRVEDGADFDDIESTSVAVVEDCRACHDGWAPDLWAYPPRWDRYYREPWWTGEPARQHLQGTALPNQRPPLAVPQPLPAADMAPGPVTGVTPPILLAPAAPADTAAAAAPRRGSGVATPRRAAPSQRGRDGERRDTPRDSEPEPKDEPAQSDAKPAPPASETRPGRGLENERGRPKP